MWDVVWNGALAGYGIAIPFGAIAMLIVTTSMRCGFACGAAAGAGAATADLAYAMTAAVAGSLAAQALAPWEEPIRWVSALVLIGLAAKGLVDARRPPVPVQTGAPLRRGELGLTYGRFLGLTIINPTTVIYFTTIVLGANVGGGLTPAEAVVFAAAAFVASLSWQTLLAGIGAGAGRVLPTGFRTVTAVAGNLFIVAIALRIVI
ncbi:MAG: LysE family transporter [Acidimicrobiia bacterium]